MTLSNSRPLLVVSPDPQSIFCAVKIPSSQEAGAESLEECFEMPFFLNCSAAGSILQL